MGPRRHRTGPGPTAPAGCPAAVEAIRAERTATPLSLLTARAADGFTPARHRDGALEVHLYDYHGSEHRTRTDLLMLAVLLVGRARARFTDRHPVPALIDRLRPVERDFLAAADENADETVGRDPTGVLDPALRAPG